MRPIIPNVDQIQQLPVTHEATVSAEWLDVMGHMNVAYYTGMFSAAMRGFRSSLGLDNEEIQRRRIGTFAIETHTRYLRESVIDDQLRVHTRVLGRSKSRKRFHAMHFAINSRSTAECFVAATFEAMVAVVSLDSRSMTPLTADVLERLDEAIKGHSELKWVAPVCGAISIR